MLRELPFSVLGGLGQTSSFSLSPVFGRWLKGLLEANYVEEESDRTPFFLACGGEWSNRTLWLLRKLSGCLLAGLHLLSSLGRALCTALLLLTSSLCLAVQSAPSHCPPDSKTLGDLTPFNLRSSSYCLELKICESWLVFSCLLRPCSFGFFCWEWFHVSVHSLKILFKWNVSYSKHSL